MHNISYRIHTCTMTNIISIFIIKETGSVTTIMLRII